MIGELINHLWQSTLFAIVTGLLAAALRKNQAQVRYRLWVVASLKFFVPFSLLISAGSHLEWAPAAHAMATQIATPDVSTRMVQVSQPFPAVLPQAQPASNGRDWILPAIAGVWVCGFVAIAFLRLRDWLRIRIALRASTRLFDREGIEVRTCPGAIEPGVVGLLGPTLLVPAGIEDQLTPHQFEAVIAHELCHVRRRDNLFAAIHMVVEALFWFLPRVWWIGARLVEERELACDEEVLSAGCDPQIYAEAILNVCKLYVGSPLACVPGVTGADIKKRIEAIMTDRIALKLNVAKKFALSIAALVALATPVIVGILSVPPLPAQSQAQTKAPAVPKFEVASIRPCGKGDFGGPGVGKKGGGRGPGGGSSPGRLTMSCMSLVDEDGMLGLVHRAYDKYADGVDHPFAMAMRPITGGPPWMRSEQYDINAVAQGKTGRAPPSQAMMNGPMLQALLEDRFKLKVHREARQEPAYLLVMGKDAHKLPPFKEGSCVVPDPNHVPPIFPSPEHPPCDAMVGGRRGPNITVEARRTSVDEFAHLLSLVLDRQVIDKTGIKGTFDIRIAFGVDQTTPRFLPGDMADLPALPSNDPPAPSIFTVVQEQLGLKLEPGKGPREYIVIDHVEKPSEN